MKLGEDKLKSDDRSFERTLNERILSATQQHRDGKTDAETKYKLEQKNNYELKVQLDQLTKTIQSLRLENQELRATNKIVEESLIKAELLEKEMTNQFK